ncbi:hypothetical protein [Agrococcus carbonis]|uniref:Uncharacterized protein n=1 Tax=Agrococcus carbonis TaxID=684552 RepID=A0A1H1L878_9MICO|nr:hypothetical protein [Agrococcus carbonis]SDR70706.1 hypothetical protein SAMN04489719_0472 [Agrococcus carbonis]
MAGTPTEQPAAAPRHWALRGFFWAMVGAIVVLPAWIMFGRALAGAPLGDALLLQAFLGPGLAILIGGVVGITIARKEVRRPRAVTWRDVRLIGPWLLVIALLGFTVVDTAGGRTGSALTAWFGDGWLTASQSFTAIGVMVTIIGGIVIFWLQVVELGRETRRRVERVVQDLQSPLLEQRARQADATFSPIDGPQSGRVISIDDDEPHR